MSAARRRRENFEILRLENTILHSFLSILQQKTYPSKVKILKIFGLRPKKWLNSPLVFQSDLTRGEFKLFLDQNPKKHYLFTPKFSRLRRDFTTVLLFCWYNLYVFHTRNDFFSSCVYFFTLAAQVSFHKLFYLQAPFARNVLCMTLCRDYGSPSCI